MTFKYIVYFRPYFGGRALRVLPLSFGFMCSFTFKATSPKSPMDVRTTSFRQLLRACCASQSQCSERFSPPRLRGYGAPILTAVVDAVDAFRILLVQATPLTFMHWHGGLQGLRCSTDTFASSSWNPATLFPRSFQLTCRFSQGPIALPRSELTCCMTTHATIAQRLEARFGACPDAGA